MADIPTRSRLIERLRAAVAVSPAPERDEDEHRGVAITFCILASALLWFSFSMRETYQRMLEVPVEVVNLDAGQSLIEIPPATARVQVEGEGFQLLRLYYDPPSIPIDAAQETVDLTAAAQEAITGVRLETIIPRTIVLQKDTRVSKRIPVKARVTVVPPPGHHVVGSPHVSPDSVTITGGRSVLQGIESWPTRWLQVQPEADSVSVTVTFSDSLSNLIELDAESAVFSASVREFTEGERSVEIVVRGLPPGQEVVFAPPTVRVIFQVALSQFEAAMDAPGFYAEISYEDARGDTTGSLVPEIHYPEGIEFREYRLDPPAVSYYFLGLN
ncbi:MAG: hypothetical protein ACI80V_002335 [Rhodothermales bacterium]|jgi:hypothetical protein